jgi:predicted AAA+ superfamily ATPase
MKTVAARTGQMLNYASIARDADISQPTAKSYLSILQTSGLVYLLYPYLQNKNKQMIKAPKLYMLDCGLAAYLTEWNTPNVLASGAMAGHFFETWCFSEILKSYYNSGKRPAFYYYRDKDQNEIDLIIEENGTLYPVEFKKAASLKKDDVKSFRILNKFNMQRGMGALVSLYPDLLQFKEDCKVIPAFQL